MADSTQEIELVFEPQDEGGTTSTCPTFPVSTPRAMTSTTRWRTPASEEREVHSEVDAVLQTWCEEQLQRYGASEWWAVVVPYNREIRCGGAAVVGPGGISDRSTRSAALGW